MVESARERKRMLDRARYQANKREILRRQAQYYKDNRSTIIERRQPYRDEYNHRKDVVAKRTVNNQRKGSQYSGKYYNKNKNKINERARNKYEYKQ
tara:strand:- start:1163 stop:1450 length:288 start_codon:yes stop_codon:yes gene_type:complete